MPDNVFLPLICIADLVLLFGVPSSLPITDQILIAVIVLATLLAGVGLLFFLFHYSRSRVPEALEQFLVESIERRRFEEQSSDLYSLEEGLEIKEGELARLEIERGIEEEETSKAALADRIEQRRGEVSRLQSQLSAERARLRAEAHAFAQNMVRDAIPPTLAVATSDEGAFFLEFTTIIVIIISVIILALLGVLNGDQLSPILASIAGYVLGRTARESAQRPRS